MFGDLILQNLGHQFGVLELKEISIQISPCNCLFLRFDRLLGNLI
ncbi:unnamed protein product, partial [Allacma fusca]